MFLSNTSTSDNVTTPTSKMKWVITPSSPTTIVSVIGLYPIKEAFSSYVHNINLTRVMTFILILTCHNSVPTKQHYALQVLS